MQTELQQYVNKVVNYSSEYGCQNTISYVAYNIVGKPYSPCEYGDLVSSYSLRSYGLSWHHNEEFFPRVHGLSPVLLPAIDFIGKVTMTCEVFSFNVNPPDVGFEVAVKPSRIIFYETYNPGAIVRVWALNVPRSWHLLWQGPPRRGSQQYTEFCPELREIDFNTKCLRIEFNQSKLDYYYGIDGILLIGKVYHRPVPFVGELKLDLRSKLKSHTCNFDDIIEGVEYILSDDFILCFDRESDECPDYSNYISNYKPKKSGSDGYFDLLPMEILVKILQYLDLQSLGRVSMSCRMLRTAAIDSSLYKKLNLKACWWLIKPSTLDWIRRRCTQLKEFDFSWCGHPKAMKPTEFLTFISPYMCGLKVLKLQACFIVDDRIIQSIAIGCSALQELDISRCMNITSKGFDGLCSMKLRRLDVSKTSITHSQLYKIVESSESIMEYLHIVNCVKINLNDLIIMISPLDLPLVCLEAWKTPGLALDGLHHIAKFQNLQILDIGWCTRNTVVNDGVTEGIAAIFYACRKLRVVQLTSLRMLVDQGVSVISIGGKALQWLDISGNVMITPAAISKLLERRHNHLKHLDISHCPLLSDDLVEAWKAMYPTVNIKSGNEVEYS